MGKTPRPVKYWIESQPYENIFYKFFLFNQQNLKKIFADAKHGVIYFSMGSNIKSKDMPEELKRGISNVFRNMKQTIIWKFEEVLPDLPKNVHILQWAPQQSILCKFC